MSSGRKAALGAAVGAGATLPAADAPRTVADGNLEVDRVRKDCKHTLHFTARTMSNMYVLRSVCVPCSHGTSTTQFNLDLTRTKTQMGVQSWNIDTVAGGDQTVETSIASKLIDPAVMMDCLFELHPVPEALAADGDWVASKLLRLCCPDLFQAAAHLHVCISIVPGKFHMLASPEKSVQEQGLSWLSSLWSAFIAMEGVAQSNHGCKSHLESMLWPGLTYCMEILVSLFEVGFKQVPPDVFAIVSAQSRAHPGTKLLEDGFNVMRGSEGGNRKGQLGRKARHQAVVQGGLVQAFGRVQPTATASSRELAEGSMSHLFRPPNSEFPLGIEHLKEWGSGGTTMSPARFSQTPLATMSMLQCAGDWSKLSLAWQSLFACSHGMPYDLEKKQSYYVMQVAVYGLLVWRLLLTRHAGNILMHFGSKASGVQPLWDFIVIADTDRWRARKCKALPPCRVAGILAGEPQDAIPPGLALVPLGPLAPLLKLFANGGFPYVNVPHLQKLCKGRGLRMGTRLPHTERACMGLLLKDILPNSGE